MTAEVTSDVGPDDRGNWTVITRSGYQVVHHTKLTAVERERVLANPTRAHELAWVVVPLRRSR